MICLILSFERAVGFVDKKTHLWVEKSLRRTHTGPNALQKRFHEFFSTLEVPTIRELTVELNGATFGGGRKVLREP
jgi:hypothetical protein